MKINNNPKHYPYVLDPGFVELINKVLKEQAVNGSDGVVLNFRDPNYSHENGGFHPVEIFISGEGVLQYLTDFAHSGCPPFVELAKELDFDFSQGIFQQFDRMYEIQVSQGLFTLYARNFVAYHQMGVYEVTVTPM